jgi:ATP-binding cassette, subfamily C, bacteriocin exporter
MKAIKQRDLSDCGVACIAAIAAHSGARLSVAHLRQISGKDQNGATVFGLVQASKLLRFIAKAVRAKPVHLNQVARPAIAHVTARGQDFHYVVLQESTGAKVPQDLPSADPDSFSKTLPASSVAIVAIALLSSAGKTALL